MPNGLTIATLNYKISGLRITPIRKGNFGLRSFKRENLPQNFNISKDISLLKKVSLQKLAFCSVESSVVKSTKASFGFASVKRRTEE
ncbi:hypothetical protein L484_013751 [Morus notabilis]|uniref:Uncharacterized protein n=1 Tax=Morus notabilis TaxID=981085 RepID=W9QWG1_9ROSA|nr:hypothetical protein L484_013751 [Morus notabilis]